MRIAVTYDNGMIYQHFGHTEHFKLYDIESGSIANQTILGTDGQGHGALVALLRACRADVLICGGIGSGAQKAIAEAGIKLYGGVSGSADDAVSAFVSGNLNFNPEVRCAHHGREHGEHSCDEFNCSAYGCGHRDM